MISVIICSKSEQLLQQVSENIEQTIGTPYEIIAIKNPNGKFGICEAYNRGAAQAKFPFLCFSHEDVLFHTKDWGQNLISHLSNAAVGVVGVCGCVIKPKSPSGAILFFGDRVNRTSMMQTTANGAPHRINDNPFNEVVSEVKILDGVFLCCRKEVWEQNHFDQAHFPAFHGYDIDFSLQVSRTHKNLVVYDILLEHMSEGYNNEAWIEAVIVMAKKWKNYLPASSQAIPLKDLRKIEHKATHYFLIEAIKNRKGLKTLAPFYLNAFAMWPLSIDNLRFIKRYLNRKKLYLPVRNK